MKNKKTLPTSQTVSPTGIMARKAMALRQVQQPQQHQQQEQPPCVQHSLLRLDNPYINNNTFYNPYLDYSSRWSMPSMMQHQAYQQQSGGMPSPHGSMPAQYSYQPHYHHQQQPFFYPTAVDWHFPSNPMTPAAAVAASSLDTALTTPAMTLRMAAAQTTPMVSRKRQSSVITTSDSPHNSLLLSSLPKTASSPRRRTTTKPGKKSTPLAPRRPASLDGDDGDEKVPPHSLLLPQRQGPKGKRRLPTQRADRYSTGRTSRVDDGTDTTRSTPAVATSPPRPSTAAATTNHSAPNLTAPVFPNVHSPLPVPTVSASQIVMILRQSGFQNEDEIQIAIRAVQLQQQQQQEQLQDHQQPSLGPPVPPVVLSVETVVCALIQAREDAQLARDMDEARRLSELEYEQETKRLQHVEQLQQDEQLLQSWSLDDLLRPTSTSTRTHSMNSISGFGGSWLLRHAALQPTLQTIMKDNPKDEDVNNKNTTAINNKRLLLRLLKLEKNARKWYSSGIPKWYFTQELAHRLLPLPSVPDTNKPSDTHSPVASTMTTTTNPTNDISMIRIQQILETICTEVEEGHSLLAKQDKNQVPWIYIHAQDKFAPKSSSAMASPAPGTIVKNTDNRDGNNINDDDEDDDIVVLDDEQVRLLTISQDTSETATIKEILVDIDR